MNINELVAELKECAAILNQIKHYLIKNNIHIPDGMPPVLALMHHHESLENELQRVHRIKRLPSGSFSVPLPTTVEEARAMATVGTQWLMDNAPSELTHPWQMYGVAKKQNDEMAALLADINEYCQTNGIGTIGDSSSKALVMDHANLEKKVKSLTHSVMLVSQYNGRLETALKKAQADYIEANSDGETDCPTPYDVYVTVAEIKNVE